MKTFEKHYVTFFSPGTFVAEDTTRSISKWDAREAMRMANDISERHGAKPYGFRFETRKEAQPVKDDDGEAMEVKPKTVKASGMYYIKGKVETLTEIEARDGESSILASNMRGNGWSKVVTTTNGYRWTQPFKKGDSLVDADGTVTETA